MTAMAKRQRVEVDEEAIKRMMSGDVPRLGTQAAQTSSPEVPPSTVQDVPSGPKYSEPEIPSVRPKRQRTGKGYTELFLHRREAAPKRQTYINQAIFTKLTKILAVIAPELTVPTFLDNVLSQHLEQYSDEINDLYERQFEKPL